MLTIFTAPKPFYGHIGVIQTNAIRSWLLLRPECEVILFGDEEGIAEVATKFGIRHISNAESNEYSTPLVSSMFSIAQDIASHQVICYVNADIILMSDFLPAVQRIYKYPFLMVGQRWDLEMSESVNFDGAQWEPELCDRVTRQGKLHPKSGIDYFVFPRGLYDDIPPFAIGRPGWDNWMIYQARSLKIPVIDATKIITIIHQNHDYSHHTEGKTGVWEGPEYKRNVELMGGINHGFNLDYATFLLTPRGLGPVLTLRHLYFRMRVIPMLYPGLYFLLIPFKVLEKSLRTIRLLREQLRTN
ncbi:hypothetical protein ACFLUJ_02635 [Chloroflexota bacterium]